MASLEELLKLNGVVAAGEFAKDGSLIDFKSSMECRLSWRLARQFCATVSMLLDTLSSAFSQLSGMNWSPLQGWAYSGGDWTVAVGKGGRKGVFIETAKADFNDLFRVLVGGQ